ncbi:Transcription termination/antitermination protein NusA [Methylacidimicrobium cyclopophantes]|uniref:Transcription termination/antitermination protein NusA n=1 Tax=Methylacidimicrobium cyclopophantes TaxID=1041766 RepID=A0A5E6M7Z4_9BACT|nr:transcription termination factor NusA [Methylacidimicrobium cyclopophantes]VVM05315.1 Transcription termination/antitermination protein NusA [Methylacidimicrobium cyclopophantes]
MNQEVLAIIEYMAREKGIHREAFLEAMQSALLAAARKSIGPARDLRVEIHPKTGKITARANLEVVEKVVDPRGQVSLKRAREIDPSAQLGQLIDVEVTPKDFGRIAAQVFKQSINQALRSIEREMVLAEFKDRVDHIVMGTVRRFDRSDVIIDLGRYEGVMPARERVPGEEYVVGDRIRAYVLAVENTPHGPQILLSRSHPNFVRRLLELEVSEVADHTVEIKAMAREPGFRTKIAVWSANPKIDPVGACVGVRGARVKNIVRELHIEKIDLFRWSSDIAELAVEALKPARIKSVELDEAGKRVKVVVDEENYSIALGRKGKNAWLAGKITGWEIDVVREQSAEENFAQKLARATEEMATALSVDQSTAEQIVRAGFLSPAAVAESEETDLASVLPELDLATVKKLRENARLCAKAS